MSNNIGTQAWAAACPRPSVLFSRGSASLPAVYVSPEAGHARPEGVAKKRVEKHVFTTLGAGQLTAQAKDAAIRMPLGPPPWRPPE
ncbi:hypothetical protein Airi02_025570 [Actinoallomurus iriomotensis]|uniref:Uncharacterized protein n=1 Tax=Actinoallomurus iriomotensis TaxID=478107 RepID=A0A9W6RZW5_9ACTN|nr:hypothetical protein [Actinoallomurus iriomotensis]GLY73128.1 hypothetical protein Airi01_013950 [Actinoallomurus iriomotensis]GLY84628.1 hypothetical protein Airi02_025570 [Actinoallomurus iriomotensis]